MGARIITHAISKHQTSASGFALRAWRGAALSAVLLALLVTVGCKGELKLVPVKGIVTVDGKPVTAGMVTFHPDADKGNKADVFPAGGIGSDGTFTLSTGGKEGAPLGWYKITVAPGAHVDMNEPPPKDKATPVLSSINERYSKAKMSGLAVEVTENPPGGAYDLKLEKTPTGGRGTF